MRFFLVGRHRGSGVVRIVSERSFATRQEALDSLAAAEQVDASFDDSDLFVVDLDAVTPVVVYRPTASVAPAASADEPPEEVWVPPVPIDEAISAGLLEPIDEATEDDVAAKAGDEGLAAALRRAATSMEAEGVQPAASVEEVIAAQSTDATAETEEPVAEPARDDALADELESLASVAAASTSEPADQPAPEPSTESSADEPPSSWPWEPAAGADAPGIVEPASELFRPSGIDEPATTASDMLAAPADDFTPRPVIMGDYGERDDFVTVEEADVAPAEAEPDAEIDSATIEDLGIPVERLDEAESTAGAVASGGDDAVLAAEPIDEALTSLEPAAASDADAAAYQPAPIDMDSYTCEDCVYAGTCPKAGEERPATCGSFQWKSV